MAKLIGIAGSTRAKSYNRALLRVAAEVVPQGSVIEIASIKDIPLYSGDLEAEKGVPSGVAELKDRIASADGLVIVTPEYNNSIPGVLKNAIDWLSRPPKDIPRVFRGKPVVLLGASNGLGGTRFSQAAWLPVLAVLGTRPLLGRPVYVPEAGKAFDADGKLVDDAIRRRVEQVIAAFAHFADEARAAAHASQAAE